MAVDFAGDPLAELTHYQQLGVDGVFVDCPSTAKEWLLATGQLSVGPSSWAGTIVSGPGEHSLLVVLSCLAACMAWSASTLQCYQGIRDKHIPQTPGLCARSAVYGHQVLLPTLPHRLCIHALILTSGTLQRI